MTSDNQDLAHYIERTPLPGQVLGFPRIAGRRISVVDIVLWDREGLAVEEIAAEFNLSQEEILAALAFYSENTEEIDRYIEEGEAFFQTGYEAQLADPVYLEKKARREELILRERRDHTGSN